MCKQKKHQLDGTSDACRGRRKGATFAEICSGDLAGQKVFTLQRTSLPNQRKAQKAGERLLSHLVPQ